MHTNEIDDRWWTIPVERSKNKKAHRGYLADTAIGLIGPLKVMDDDTKEMKPKGFIFPCRIHTKDKPMARLAISRALLRNVSPAGLTLGVASFTPHDLRRTAATCMSQIGFMDEVIDAVLNHSKQGVIRTYNLNRYDKEKQQALEAWERKLNSIINATVSAKVIPITRKAA